jgi:hypothetical protein
VLVHGAKTVQLQGRKRNDDDDGNDDDDNK